MNKQDKNCVCCGNEIDWSEADTWTASGSLCYDCENEEFETC